MKKRIAAVITALSVTLSGITALASGAIPDHRGTPMDGIAVGTQQLNKSVKSYSELFKAAGNQYGVDPNLLAAICMQESSGRNLSYREDGTEYPAWGIMQIEYTNEKSFAQFGLQTTGQAFTLQDRLGPEKSINNAAWLISRSLISYDCDYLKMIQAYNFGQTVLDRIIAAKGDDWLNERINSAKYADNWKYDKYGDAQYIEHVLRYYRNDIEYIGAKVRINGKLLSFEDQYPLVEDGHTMIPIRAVAEALNAEAEWDHENYTAIIKKGNTVISIPINEHIAYIDGEQSFLDAPSEIINDRTMVPLRFISEALNANVSWEQDTRTVMISY